MNRKLLFYDRYGVEEYYIYDPQKNNLTGWLRSETWLDIIEPINGWVSPRLGIRFDLSSDNLVLYRPDGQPFADYLEAQQQLTTMTEQLEQERQRNQRLEQLLREAGLNPDANL
ncbi:hypothetical protein SPLC1_S204310 [Arthrospira platensis C1]|nr:hypothetical protein SPLC1_S204310 [Arthrospira platensis C1]